jgi:hypothetical protein
MDNEIKLFEESGVCLEPLNSKVNLESEYTRLNINSEQKKQISSLMQFIPTTMAAETLAESYTVKFPDGLQHTLMPLKQGGVSTTYKDENGRFAGSASLYSAADNAIALYAFNAMAIASSQYFLANINTELKMMNQKLDRILEFLYGDKKAELIAEVNFVKYAYKNYISIMNCDSQRIATLTSLQESKKVAMKDIEFYINDLEREINKKDNIENMVDNVKRIKDSLELSLQLYGMSSVLEMYYAQNFDSTYVDYLESEISVYIAKCEKRMLSCLSMFSKSIEDHKSKFLSKIDKSSHRQLIGEWIDALNRGEESNIKQTLKTALREATSPKEFCINHNGDVYLKVS